jgi:hypothetical protein
MIELVQWHLRSWLTLKELTIYYIDSLRDAVTIWALGEDNVGTPIHRV